ncbi:MAG TPA: DUF1816 domain-containing protein [Stenomitos sp.]
MVGVFFFVLLFALICLLLQMPKRQTTSVISSLDVALPTQTLEEFSESTANGIAWWVKIITETPHCTYYFGPFESSSEAKQNQSGYLEDLEQEGAQGIDVAILQDRPETLTIYDEQE